MTEQDEGEQEEDTEGENYQRKTELRPVLQSGERTGAENPSGSAGDIISHWSNTSTPSVKVNRFWHS